MDHKFQIAYTSDDTKTAGYKALYDAMKIAEEMGYEVLTINTSMFPGNDFFSRILRHINRSIQWIKVYHRISKNSIIFYQYPCRSRQILRTSILKKLSKKKKARIIALVHDVEELRGNISSTMINEFNTLIFVSSIIIVHNEEMKRYFVEGGVSESRIVTLGVFDYLRNDSPGDSKFERSLTVAGNLSSGKSSYIEQLHRLGKFKINLFGINVPGSITNHSDIIYHGSFKSDDIPPLFSTGFGLVWDGDSIETCSGPFGEYLRYNNPHKLSLYLSSNMPVVIWSKAAMAGFVKENDCGILVDSLYEAKNIITNMSKDEYDRLAFNAGIVGKRIREGRYLKGAILKAGQIITEAE